MGDIATIAVIFGGRSVEHDVSVLTGIQFLEALDQSRYRGLAVYVDPDGQWWCGDALRRRSSYPLSPQTKESLDAVTLPVGVAVGSRGPHLLTARRGLLGSRVEAVSFDLMVPAIHGSFGEDGSLQGLLAFAGIPFVGSRALGAAATMDKHFTKESLRALGLPVLPHALIARPQTGGLPPRALLEEMLDEALKGPRFPLIVKPRRLGSSVGVALVEDMDALEAALLAAFRLDNSALVEPVVPDLIEYNVAVMRVDGGIRTSAIERPLAASAVLDFSNKYLAGAGAKGTKSDGLPSEGMASLNREIAPDSLSPEQDARIRDAATRAFAHFELAGTVRIDFLANGRTGELWLNEINAIPGSFAWFLWQAASEPIGFTALATLLVEEGFRLAENERGARDVAAGRSQIFRRD